MAASKNTPVPTREPDHRPLFSLKLSLEIGGKAARWLAAFARLWLSL